MYSGSGARPSYATLHHHATTVACTLLYRYSFRSLKTKGHSSYCATGLLTSPILRVLLRSFDESALKATIFAGQSSVTLTTSTFGVPHYGMNQHQFHSQLSNGAYASRPETRFTDNHPSSIDEPEVQSHVRCECNVVNKRRGVDLWEDHPAGLEGIKEAATVVPPIAVTPTTASSMGREGQGGQHLCSCSLSVFQSLHRHFE